MFTHAWTRYHQDGSGMGFFADSLKCRSDLTLTRESQVSRYFRDFLRESTILQLRRKIFTAGLIENPSVSCDFALRRKAYEEHAHKWSNAGRVVKRVQELPLGLFSKPHSLQLSEEASSPPMNQTLIALPSLASRRRSAESQSSGGVSLHSPLSSGVLPHTCLIMYSLLVK